MGDYTAVSAREQRDLQLLMTQCDSAVANAEAFAERLELDLNLLDGVSELRVPTVVEISLTLPIMPIKF